MTLGDEMSRRRVRTRTAASIACAILALCGGVCVAGSAGAVSLSEPGPLEEGDVIYQVLVDRFENGNPTNDDFGDGRRSRMTLASIAAVIGRGRPYVLGVGGHSVDAYPAFG